MGRAKRLLLNGLPYVLHNVCVDARCAFSLAEHVRAWVTLAREHAQAHQLQLHGYALTPQSMWILATPAQGAALPAFMRALSKASTHCFNQLQDQQGSLWQARYRASLVQPGLWALDVLQYMESIAGPSGFAGLTDTVNTQPGLAPLAWAVNRSEPHAALGLPQATPLGAMANSRAHHSGLARLPGLHPLAAWWQLGNTPFAREAAWQQRHEQGLSPERRQLISDLITRQWPLADASFLRQLQQQTGLPLLRKPRGRPRTQAMV